MVEATLATLIVLIAAGIAFSRGVGVSISEIEKGCAKLAEVGEEVPIRWRLKAALLRGGYAWRTRTYNGAGLYSYDTLHLSPKGYRAAEAYRWRAQNG